MGKWLYGRSSRTVAGIFLSVNRICAGHDIDNPNSGRVMQKIGMKYEGTLRQSGKNNQGIVDMANYSVLREEWRLQQQM